MTARLYFRCPIKAALFAKYYGVKFANGDSLRSACEMIGTNGRDLQNGGAFYLSREAERLLDGLTADQKAAMRLLGMWPESEGV